MAKLNCDNCGVCCSTVGSPPFIDDEVKNLPIDLQNQVFELGYSSDSNSLKPCYWWDASTKKCKHHSHRPQVCKDFETGGIICIKQREFYNIEQTPIEEVA